MDGHAASIKGFVAILHLGSVNVLNVIGNKQLKHGVIISEYLHVNPHMIFSCGYGWITAAIITIIGLTTKRFLIFKLQQDCLERSAIFCLNGCFVEETCSKLPLFINVSHRLAQIANSWLCEGYNVPKTPFLGM